MKAKVVYIKWIDSCISDGERTREQLDTEVAEMWTVGIHGGENERTVTVSRELHISDGAPTGYRDSITIPRECIQNYQVLGYIRDGVYERERIIPGPDGEL